MRESRYGEAYRNGYAIGFGDARRRGEERARDSFWCGFLLALATWPLAAAAWVLWKVLA